MSQKAVKEVPDVERMRAALELLKHDLARFEALLSPSEPTQALGPSEDIFAEMDGISAHAPHADDSREAIYTRMPGE